VTDSWFRVLHEVNCIAVADVVRNWYSREMVGHGTHGFDITLHVICSAVGVYTVHG